jgi:hypothetical protein
MWHVFQAAARFAPEARRSLKRIAGLLTSARITPFLA